MINTKMGAFLLVGFIAGAFIASPELRAFAANTVGSADIINNSILSADIKDGEVKAVDLGANSVTAAKIKDGEVKSPEIQDGTIQAADVSTGYISYGFKAAGQDGWIPCFAPCGRIIANVPGAVDGAKVFVMLNYSPGQVSSGFCVANDVVSNSFRVYCENVAPGTFLDYVMITPP